MSSNEMRLARVDLGPSWLDLGYGEPVIVQEVLHKHTKQLVLPNKKKLLSSQYQPPQGNKELVTLLEDKYKAKVVVANGAKQGIAAVMYALKKLGHTRCVIHRPYWVSTPTIIEDVGLGVDMLDNEKPSNAKAFMVTSPNNPDGKELTRDQLLAVSEDAKASGVALIHDAAYYTPIYTEHSNLNKVGDAQVYSFSKMYGLSGLRLGYVVIHNEALLPGVVEFIERSCSGVSTASQAIALALELFFRDNPTAKEAFEKESREAISASRKELANLDPEVLKVMPCSSNSMFAWCEEGPRLDAVAAKVNIISGELFGQAGMVRLNIAVKPDIIRTAVERLNNARKQDESKN